MGAKFKPWIAVKKKRGGQPGNRNRLVHGRYSGELKARRARVRALIVECNIAVALARLQTVLSSQPAAPAAMQALTLYQPADSPRLTNAKSLTIQGFHRPLGTNRHDFPGISP